MKCREAKGALDRRTILGSEEADALARHLGACPNCAAIARTRRLSRLFLDALTADEGPSPYFMARLRARLGEIAVSPVAPRFWVKLLVPTLATLTLILGSAAYFLSPHSSPPPLLQLLHSQAGASETFVYLGIPQPTREQVLASVLGVEEQAP
jgi:anti-sigma factor RsiW